MHTIFFEIGVVVVASAILAWLALLAKQPIILAYIGAGVLLGPWGLGLVREVEFVDGVSRIGVTLLLFLAGLALHPRRLFSLFRETLIISLVSGVVFWLVGYLFAQAWGYSGKEAFIIGLAMTFSSTILVVKLLPTTALHQKRMGSLCIAVLIAQDLVAVTSLIIINSNPMALKWRLILLPLYAVLLIATTLAAEQFILRRIMARIETFQELLYLMTLAWCFGVAMIFEWAGLSPEVGAFIAGIALARSSIATILSEGLKFFRDFFLVLFFFVLGAQTDLVMAKAVLLPAFILCVIIILIKSGVYFGLFKWAGEEKRFSWEISVRLSQTSEFSLILAVFAAEIGAVSSRGSQLIQMVTIFSLIISSYLTVNYFPNPLGMKKFLKLN